MSGRVLLPLAVVAATVSIVADGSATSVAPPQSYSLAATVKCLENRDAAVLRIKRRDDTRLVSLHDLSQRTSRKVRFRSQTVGMAFTPTVGKAELLVELLRVPNDRYRLERRRNVVVMARPRDRAASGLIAKCLRVGTSAADRRT